MGGDEQIDAGLPRKSRCRLEWRAFISAYALSCSLDVPPNLSMVACKGATSTGEEIEMILSPFCFRNLQEGRQSLIPVEISTSCFLFDNRHTSLHPFWGMQGSCSSLRSTKGKESFCSNSNGIVFPREKGRASLHSEPQALQTTPVPNPTAFSPTFSLPYKYRCSYSQFLVETLAPSLSSQAVFTGSIFPFVLLKSAETRSLRHRWGNILRGRFVLELNVIGCPLSLRSPSV